MKIINLVTYLARRYHLREENILTYLNQIQLPEELQIFAEKIHAHEGMLYLTGGAPRNLLLNLIHSIPLSVYDFDITLLFDSKEIKKLGLYKPFKNRPLYLLQANDNQHEIAVLESDLPIKNPTYIEKKQQESAESRDHTWNALFIPINAEGKIQWENIYDFCDSFLHLENLWIRTIATPQTSFGRFIEEPNSEKIYKFMRVFNIFNLLAQWQHIDPNSYWPYPQMTPTTRDEIQKLRKTLADYQDNGSFRNKLIKIFARGYGEATLDILEKYGYAELIFPHYAAICSNLKRSVSVIIDSHTISDRNDETFLFSILFWSSLNQELTSNENNFEKATAKIFLHMRRLLLLTNDEEVAIKARWSGWFSNKNRRNEQIESSQPKLEHIIIAKEDSSISIEQEIPTLSDDSSHSLPETIAPKMSATPVTVDTFPTHIMLWGDIIDLRPDQETDTNKNRKLTTVSTPVNGTTKKNSGNKVSKPKKKLKDLTDELFLDLVKQPTNKQKWIFSWITTLFHNDNKHEINQREEQLEKQRKNQRDLGQVVIKKIEIINNPTPPAKLSKQKSDSGDKKSIAALKKMSFHKDNKTRHHPKKNLSVYELELLNTLKQIQAVLTSRNAHYKSRHPALQFAMEDDPQNTLFGYFPSYIRPVYFLFASVFTGASISISQKIISNEDNQYDSQQHWDIALYTFLFCLAFISLFDNTTAYFRSADSSNQLKALSKQLGTNLDKVKYQRSSKSEYYTELVDKALQITGKEVDKMTTRSPESRQADIKILQNLINELTGTNDEQVTLRQEQASMI